MAPLTVTATPWPYFTVAPRTQFMDFHLDFGTRNNKAGRQVPDDFPEHLQKKHPCPFLVRGRNHFRESLGGLTKCWARKNLTESSALSNKDVQDLR